MANRSFGYRLALVWRYYVLGAPSLAVDLLVSWLYPKESTMGFRIVDLMQGTHQQFLTLAKGALTLIATSDPRRFKRVEREIRTIVNQPVLSAGQYFRPMRVCCVDIRCLYDSDPEIVIKLLASLLIHEATHGALFSANILRTRRNHSRVEMLCSVESKRFLARVGITSSPWDSVTTENVRRYSVRTRLARLAENLSEIRTRDGTEEAEVWDKVLEERSPPQKERGD
jgi:hypothetical protein